VRGGGEIWDGGGNAGRREMDRTYRALMKLLLLSMEASSMVIGPAPMTPVQHTARSWHNNCIPLFPCLRRKVGGEGNNLCAGETMQRGQAKASGVAAAYHWSLEWRGTDVSPAILPPTETGRRRRLSLRWIGVE
jgi:hypothetical protein